MCGGRKCKLSQLCKRRVALEHILIVDSAGMIPRAYQKDNLFEIRIINIEIKIVFLFDFV